MSLPPVPHCYLIIPVSYLFNPSVSVVVASSSYLAQCMYMPHFFPSPGSSLLCLLSLWHFVSVYFFCICFFCFWPLLACLWISLCAFALFGLLFAFMISAWLWTLILYFCLLDCLPGFWISACVFGLRPLPATSLNVYFTPTLSLRLVLCPCFWQEYTICEPWRSLGWWTSSILYTHMLSPNSQYGLCIFVITILIIHCKIKNSQLFSKWQNEEFFCYSWNGNNIR